MLYCFLQSYQQAEKLKSCETKKGWMKNDEGWWFEVVEGLCRWTDAETIICECRVTENVWYT